MWTTTKTTITHKEREDVEEEEEEEEILLKIIDLDSAHLIDDDFGEETNRRLRGLRTSLAERELGGIRMKSNFDISLMNLLKNHENNERLQSNDKEILDRHFLLLQHEEIKLST
jgi:hypothetical protein